MMRLTSSPLPTARRLTALFALVGTLSLAGVAAAQTKADRAAAQVLFDTARDLQKAGKNREACPKFQQSFQLDPAIGTQINLAKCYEDTGRIASAWINYNEVAGTARGEGQTKRATYARQRADALKPQLSTVTVEVAGGAQTRVTLDGQPLSSVTFGTALPIDGGDHVLRASAPQKMGWELKFSVGPTKDRKTVNIPMLQAGAGPAPVSVPVPPAPPSGPTPAGPKAPGPGAGGAGESGDGNGSPALVALAITSAVFAVGGGVGGGVLRAMALSRDDESLLSCAPDDPNRCNQTGADLRDEAKTLQTGSTIAWIAGGGFAVLSAVLFGVAASSGGGDGADATAVAHWPRVWAGPGQQGGSEFGIAYRTEF